MWRCCRRHQQLLTGARGKTSSGDKKKGELKVRTSWRNHPNYNKQCTALDMQHVNNLQSQTNFSPLLNFQRHNHYKSNKIIAHVQTHTNITQIQTKAHKHTVNAKQFTCLKIPAFFGPSLVNFLRLSFLLLLFNVREINLLL